jgi:hypothetical protein
MTTAATIPGPEKESSAKNRRYEGNKQHRKADAETPQGITRRLSLTDNIFEKEGKGKRDHHHAEGSVGKIKKQP